MLPNFLIVGGIATGTSFLSATLVHHPDIYLPRIQRPEPNFFHYTDKYSRGLDWYQETFFHEASAETAVGERSSLLLTSPKAPERIAASLPQVKLIFCLRNPIERAWGNYRFSVLEGLETLSFADALMHEDERMQKAEGRWAEVQPHAYVNRSRYVSGLKKYISLFGKENLLLLKSEELGRNPAENISRVCSFLNVEPRSDLPLPPNYSSPSVSDPAIQTELRAYFGDRFPALIEAIRKEEKISSNEVSDQDDVNIERLRENLRGQKEPMPEECRQRLRFLLEDEIAAVQEMVDFSVDDWT
ncbi:hypothetical protein IWQ52_000866 [Labrenzia sp. EL_159]|nr:hypothetical protein [Labrenzia sp. EL_162]MBG6193364.1 hypothetical protein [Labrenzia sp. EL_159]